VEGSGLDAVAHLASLGVESVGSGVLGYYLLTGCHICDSLFAFLAIHFSSKTHILGIYYQELV